MAFSLRSKNKTMLRPTLMFLLLVFLSYNLDAQSRWGVRLGGNLSTLKISGYCTSGCSVINQNRTLSTGFQVGLSANHQLRPGWSLDTDVIYSRRGYGVDIYGELHSRLNYLSFPLLLNIQLLDSPIDILAGLETGILLSATDYLNGARQKVKEQWHEIDAGINLGVAYRFSPAIRVKMSYLLGFFSIYKSSEAGRGGYWGGGAGLKMRSFQFSVYTYPFQGRES